MFSSRKSRISLKDSLADYLTYYREDKNLPEFAEDAFRYFKPVFDAFPHGTGEFSAVIAGGALRSLLTGKPVSDFDIYVSPNNFSTFMDPTFHGLGKVWHGNAEIHMYGDSCGKILSHGGVSRDVIKFHGELTPQDVLSTFDLSVIMCAIDKDQIIWHKDFIEDNARNRLRFINFHDPQKVMTRMVKYIKMGYTPRSQDLEAIARYLNEELTIPEFVVKEPNGTIVESSNTNPAGVIPF